MPFPHAHHAATVSTRPLHILFAARTRAHARGCTYAYHAHVCLISPHTPHTTLMATHAAFSRHDTPPPSPSIAFHTRPPNCPHTHGLRFGRLPSRTAGNMTSVLAGGKISCLSSSCLFTLSPAPHLLRREEVHTGPHTYTHGLRGLPHTAALHYTWNWYYGIRGQDGVNDIQLTPRESSSPAAFPHLTALRPPPLPQPRWRAARTHTFTTPAPFLRPFSGITTFLPRYLLYRHCL